MSAFSNHVICDACWRSRNPGRQPIRMVDDHQPSETCCFCGEKTKAAIFVREKNENVACKTDHSVQEKR